MADIRITGHGSIVLFAPLTEAARETLDEFVASEPWQWLGGALGVDHRYALGLASHLSDEHGLELEYA